MSSSFSSFSSSSSRSSGPRPSSSPKLGEMSNSVSEETYQSYNARINHIFFAEDTFAGRINSLITLANAEKAAGNTLFSRFLYQFADQAVSVLQELLESKYDLYKFRTFPEELSSAMKAKEIEAKTKKSKEEGDETVYQKAVARNKKALKDVHLFFAELTHVELDRIWQLFEEKVEAALKEQKENLKCPLNIRGFEDFKKIWLLKAFFPSDATKLPGEPVRASAEYKDGLEALKAKNQKEATSKFRIAATLGHKDAGYQFACTLVDESGHGEEARYLFAVDAIRGNPSSCLQMIRYCHDQDKVVSEGKEVKRSDDTSQNHWIKLFQHTFDPSEAIKWDAQRAYNGFLSIQNVPALQKEAEFLCKLAIKGNDPVSKQAVRALIQFWSDAEKLKKQSYIYDARVLFDRAFPGVTRGHATVATGESKTTPVCDSSSKVEVIPEEQLLKNSEREMIRQQAKCTQEANIRAQVNSEYLQSLQNDEAGPRIYFDSFYRSSSTFYKALAIQSTGTHGGVKKYGNTGEERGVQFLTFCLNQIPVVGSALGAAPEAGLEVRQDIFRETVQCYIEEIARKEFGSADTASQERVFLMLAQQVALTREDTVNIKKPTGKDKFLGLFQSGDMSTNAHYQARCDFEDMVKRVWWSLPKGREAIRAIVAEKGGVKWLAALIMQSTVVGVKESKEPQSHRYTLEDVRELPDDLMCRNRYQELMAKEMLSRDHDALYEKTIKLEADQKKMQEELVQSQAKQKEMQEELVRSQAQQKEMQEELARSQVEQKAAQERTVQLEAKQREMGETLLQITRFLQLGNSAMALQVEPQASVSLVSSPLAPQTLSALTSSSSSSTFASSARTNHVEESKNPGEKIEVVAVSLSASVSS